MNLILGEVYHKIFFYFGSFDDEVGQGYLFLKVLILQIEFKNAPLIKLWEGSLKAFIFIKGNKATYPKIT
jgi:hypothetical protein